MVVANTLFYYNTVATTAIKSFILQAPGVNTIKPFFKSLKIWTVKLVFVPVIYFQRSLLFVGNTLKVELG
jgi:hypothetical protein